MIIGISGRIGSGKDTVGKIIQELIQYNKDQSSEIKKFAGKLKETASILTGIPIEKFEDQEFKNTNLSSEWNYALMGEDWVDGKPILVPMTVRTLLQKLGTEAMREGLHKNVWVNALFANYKKEGGSEGGERVASDGGYYSAPSYKGEYPNWIITDMRFPNEMESVVERNGITICVIRDYALRGNPEDPKNIHPSETSLDDAKFDYEIINDGTIEDLERKVKEILVKEKLI